MNIRDKLRLSVLMKVCGVLAVVLLVIFICLHIFFPRERVKAAVARELSHRLNQDVSVERISVGFYPDLELIAKGVRARDRDTGAEVVSIERLYLDVDLLQLLRRRVLLDDIVITSPELHLVRERDGQWNTKRVLEGMKNERQEPAGARTFGISPIRIRRGAVRIRDDAASIDVAIDDINATYDMTERVLRLDSAAVALPFLNARVTGTISELATSDPVIALSAEGVLLNDGPLSWLQYPDGARKQPVAEIHLQASGKSRNLLLQAAFSIDPAYTGGVKTAGALRGRLQSPEGLLEIKALDASIGRSTVSLSGNFNKLYSKAREAQLSGKGNFEIKEFITAIRRNPASSFEPEGTVKAVLNVQGSAKQISLQSDMDLLNAGLTIPRLMRKERGAPARLKMNAVFTPPGNLVIEDFDFAVDRGKVQGRAEVSPNSDPPMRVSLNTVNFPLKKLDRIEPVRFEEGNLILHAVLSKDTRESKELNFEGTGTIEKASLSADVLAEPVRELYASFAVKEKKATLESASFSFGTSAYHVEGAIDDLSAPHITGSLRTPKLNVNEIVAALGKKDARQPSAEPPNRPPGQSGRPLSLELVVAADSLYAGSTTTGPISATWSYANDVHTFDPITIASFEGTIHGRLQLDASKEPAVWKTQFDARQLDLEQVMAQFHPEKTRITGEFEMSGELDGIAGGGKKEVLSSMNGRLKVRASDGEIRQYAMLRNIFLLMQLPIGTIVVPGVRETVLLNALLDALKTGGRSLDPTNIAYSRIRGTWMLAGGVAHSDELRLETGVAHLLFSGDVDLAENHMDMTVRATPLGSLGSIMGKIPLAGEELQKVKETILSTDFVVRGPVSDPSVRLAAAEKILGKDEAPIKTPATP